MPPLYTAGLGNQRLLILPWRMETPVLASYISKAKGLSIFVISEIGRDVAPNGISALVTV